MIKSLKVSFNFKTPLFKLNTLTFQTIQIVNIESETISKFLIDIETKSVCLIIIT
jgi:hypothetical protein